MEIETFNRNDELIRCERGIITNLDSIIRLINGDIASQESPLLAISVFLYICDTMRNNLFNFGVFDPKEFAEKYDFSESFLRMPHPDPYQIRNFSPEDRYEYERYIREEKGVQSMKVKESGAEDDAAEITGRYWTTNLENALYVFQNRPFNMAMGGAFTDNYLKGFSKGEEVLKVSTSFQLITSLMACRYRRRIIYKYSLNERVMANLCNYFVQLDRPSVVKMLRTSVEHCELYIFLQNVRNVMKDNGEYRTGGCVKVDFMTLCRKAGVHDSYSQLPEGEALKYRKRDINKMFRQVAAVFTPEYSRNVKERLEEGVPVVSLLWEKRDEDKGRAAYGPVIQFNDLRLNCSRNPYGKGMKPGWMKRNEGREERKDIFMEQFMIQLSSNFNRSSCRNIWSMVEAEPMLQWLADPAQSPLEKRNALDNAMVTTYNMIPSDVDARMQEIVRISREAVDEGRDINHVFRTIRDRDDICWNVTGGRA